MMTVKDLQVFLSKSNPDLPVILAKDPEGDGFRGLYLVQEANFIPFKYGDMDVFNPEDAPKESKQCITLWPS